LGERVDVRSLDALAIRLHTAHVGPVKLASPELIRELLQQASATVPGHKFGQRFVLSEWEQVVDAWQLQTWEAYRDVARLGRKTRLPEAQRKTLWAIFDHLRAVLRTR